MSEPALSSPALSPEEQAARADLLERARLLFAGRVDFLKSAPALKFLPDPEVPEIAFAGRSNVGKSSLLNALTGRKSIARTSVTPGRTQELNFFEVGEPTRLRLVDMPGYGFAKAPPKVVEQWRRLVRDYLRGRVVLKRTLLLIDSRHGVKPVDDEMMQMLDEAGVGYRVVLTKADKIKATDLAQVLADTQAAARKRTAAYPQVLVTSSELKLGIEDLRAAVLEDSEI
ncbi:MULTISPECIES: ribosome biogenesis GTP-binding protein YihA/YsxC [unclassified Novosphingobium]|uniref:ribosome biogenesis GTP-binding protein YihA/YsxC n=1 Tax=unclassified Novosphingobium TaxID=2644732 RepID=UPI000F5F73C8|nr:MULTISPECIES: ribosome biogenesis GTP-binding protein YihA/YsxC [unclassified Novosphingobium]MBF5090070.1 YihA family ribosome biogenesis GTP-binding protein [Novosphingobium sp. NBM11]RQW45224.1 YihA family ribosome biogenesis GTP-binding protein [Novosphingobium sp. LASN5T]